MSESNSSEWKDHIGYGFVVLCLAVAFAVVNWSCDQHAANQSAINQSEKR